MSGALSWGVSDISVAPGMPAEVREVQEQALSWPLRAEAYAVTDAKTYAAGWEHLKGIKALRAEAEKTFRPIIEKAHAAHKEACAQLKKVDQPLEQAERTIKGKLALYEEEQERLRLEEQRRRQAIEEEQREAELEQAIEEAEAQGATVAEIEAMIDQSAAAPAPPLVVAPAVARPTGGTVSKRWDVEVTDKQALIAACAKDPRFSNLLEVNVVAARQLAQALGTMFAVPGLRAYQKSVVGVRQ